ncbi:MAG: hypothetical protein ACP5M4_07645 [Acidobacteriaceae bacterium]
MRRNFLLPLLLIGALSSAAHAQRQSQPTLPKGTLAVVIPVSNLYVQPSLNSQRLTQIQPGREAVITEKNGKWIRVFANVDEGQSHEDQATLLGPENPPQPVSGWMLDKGLVTEDTPHADQILFGAAQEQEDAATQPDPPPHAAQAARRLYLRVIQLFPKSRLVADAMWRAADIRWQLQKADAATLPSAHTKQPYMRELPDENEMHAIMHYFPKTKWADFAAFTLIENKLCGDWQGDEKCPEKEAQYYLDYAHKYPDSPDAPEALYKAAWREAAAGDMWQADGNKKFADRDRGYVAGIVDQLDKKYPDSQYATRAATLAFEVNQGIQVYGTGTQ